MPAFHSISNLLVPSHSEGKFQISNSFFNKAGFTLLELMIAISIVAIISAIGLTSFNQSQKLARDSKRKQDLRSIAVALELFYQKNGRYPCITGGSWQTSQGGTDWLEDKGTGVAPCPSSNTKINPTYINTTPKDPLNTGTNIPSAGHSLYGYWGGYCGNNYQYILTALLENSADKETKANRGNFNLWCDGGTPLDSWNANTFIISTW